MADKKKNRKQLTLRPTTVAYAWLDKPDSGHKFSNNKFKTTFVYDDVDDMAKIEEAVVELAEAEWGDKVSIDEVKRPYRTADEQTKEAFQGKVTITASSKFKPDLRDAKRKKLPPKVKIFGGDVCAAIVMLMPYESTEKVREGNKTITVTVYGVSAQLQAVQLVTKNSNGGSGADAFEEYDDGYDGSTFEDWGDDDQAEGEDIGSDDDGDF